MSYVTHTGLRSVKAAKVYKYLQLKYNLLQIPLTSCPRCSGPAGFESDVWPFAACRRPVTPLSRPVKTKP